MADTLSPEWLVVGRIVAPQGLDGSLRVYPDSDFPERFLEPGDRWLLRPGQAEPEVVQLVAGRYWSGSGLYVIQLAGVQTREQAEALRESALVVRAGDRLPLEPDEFHVADLIGLAVRLQATGRTIGTVVDVYAAGNDLLAIELMDVQPDAETTVPATPSSHRGQKPEKPPAPILIPFVCEIVPVVNLTAGYVEICPPRGLLPL
jgi:16S rRNA processing protein RimM